ncbi:MULTISPECIES: heavy-metal-associated domain-containing protein [Ramlibacter]|uniref:Copper chaperone n=1 Tax=Ramlibacter pinisoli TaxID=2682844 RepID=A0A6N8IS96_9BURK|nr:MULTISPECIES: heavy-metal-associated domain-containing protein [Ramlibacter]MBA2964489.1 heavy-metal-associated domain-containing protein [Ramlibacter sp. CGMCC 1.13660]MVQ29455.1 copper chaperone [Ramlibacter pinisoli]
MHAFKLPAMSCGHCVQAVTEAVHEVDPQARVEVDLARKEAQVESAQPRERFAAALTEAGYTPAG